MTTCPEAPVESAQRRTSAMARLVLRAVGAGRKAMRAVGEALGMRRAGAPRRAVRHDAAKAGTSRPAAQRWLTVPLALWRQVVPAAVDAWLARQNPKALGRARRRFFLGTAADPFTSCHAWELVRKANAPSLDGEAHTLASRLLLHRTFDRPAPAEHSPTRAPGPQPVRRRPAEHGRLREHLWPFAHAQPPTATHRAT